MLTVPWMSPFFRKVQLEKTAQVRAVHTADRPLGMMRKLCFYLKWEQRIQRAQSEEIHVAMRLYARVGVGVTAKKKKKITLWTPLQKKNIYTKKATTNVNKRCVCKTANIKDKKKKTTRKWIHVDFFTWKISSLYKRSMAG